MKTFIQISLVMVFALLTPLFVLLLTIKLSGISADFLKRELSQNRLYDKLTDSLYTTLDDSVKKADPDDPLLIIGPFLRTEITVDYLKNKIETLITDTDDWVKGKRVKEPAFSIEDLKEKLVRKNFRIIDELEKFSAEIKTRKPEIEEAMKESGNQQQVKNLDKLTNFDLSAFIKKDASIPLGKYLGFLKTLSFWSTTGLLLLFGLLLGILILIFFLSASVKAGFKWTGLVFIFSSLWNILPWFSAFLFSKVLLLNFLQNTSLPSFLIPAVQIIIQPVTDKYIQVGGASIIIFLVAGIIAIIISTAFHTIIPAEMKSLHTVKDTKPKNRG